MGHTRVGGTRATNRVSHLLPRPTLSIAVPLLPIGVGQRRAGRLIRDEATRVAMRGATSPVPECGFHPYSLRRGSTGTSPRTRVRGRPARCLSPATGGAGRALKGVAAYRYQLQTTLVTAARLAGHPVTWTVLFQDVCLLGRSLVDDTPLFHGTRLSRWTLARRRSPSLRSHPDAPGLTARLGDHPHTVVDRALRTVAERVGAGYRLTGGAPRQRVALCPLLV